MRCSHQHPVTYLLKTRILELEREPLLTNGYETFVSRQRLSKRVPAATGTHAKTEALLETVFEVIVTPRVSD
jgi:hypothetical protein